jgi:hypothetical protein
MQHSAVWGLLLCAHAAVAQNKPVWTVLVDSTSHHASASVLGTVVRGKLDANARPTMTMVCYEQGPGFVISGLTGATGLVNMTERRPRIRIDSLPASTVKVLDGLMDYEGFSFARTNHMFAMVRGHRIFVMELPAYDGTAIVVEFPLEGFDQAADHFLQYCPQREQDRCLEIEVAKSSSDKEVPSSAPFLSELEWYAQHCKRHPRSGVE